MSIIVDRFNKINSNIKKKNVNIIAVSKTFSYDHIKPLVDYGHSHFGENKVQESESKWKNYKDEKINVQLIGKLQSNKAKKAVELFDYVHSLDNPKLAITLSKFEHKLSKNLQYFIQVNVGSEVQKSGIPPSELDSFYTYCSKELKLNVIGLMAIPPNDGNEEKHFKYLFESNSSLGLEHLSMGMSSDLSLIHI